MSGLASLQYPVNALEPLQVTASPVSGGTLALPSDLRDMVVLLTPTAALAALTVTLPPDAATRIGQRIRFCPTQNVAGLALVKYAVDGNTGFYNAVPSFIAGQAVEIQKQSASTWF